MLYSISSILILCWTFAVATDYTADGLVHLLLVAAILLTLLRVSHDNRSY